MGAQQSKEELLFQQVNYGNIEGIKTLHRDGAGLEWIDKEGRTPLILACMRPDLLPVAKVLMELGASVNAYRPGSHAGTPLHHAAKRGLDQTVNLLLSYGANPLLLNDDCHTALDLAREKGNINVVRSIESRISLFSGWLRELYGPSFLEPFVKNWVTKKIWAVVYPYDFRNPLTPTKFAMALYTDLQVAKPVSVISLWKVQIDVPDFGQPDPALNMADKSKKRVYKFFSAREGDKQQLHWLYNACRGIRQVNNYVQITPVPPPTVTTPHPPAHIPEATKASVASSQEEIQVAMALRASIESAIAEGVPLTDVGQTAPTGGSTNGWGSPPRTTHNGWGSSDGGQASMASSTQEAPPPLALPSAPPIVDDDFNNGPISYPSVDATPVDLAIAHSAMNEAGSSSGAKEGGSSSTCVICLDAPVEGACIPCGHMAGCMSCLNGVKAKGWGCPVCRADIQQVVRLYAV